jgi:hypothetical protein
MTKLPVSIFSATKRELQYGLGIFDCCLSVEPGVDVELLIRFLVFGVVYSPSTGDFT